MNIVAVSFKGSSPSNLYFYTTKLDLIQGGEYDIEVDERTRYDNHVIIRIVDVPPSEVPMGTKLRCREITSALLITAPKRPDGGVKGIYPNPKKGVVVVVWKDGTKTRVDCQDGEPFDVEKGIALCFMKKAFNNRGCYNNVLKQFAQEYQPRTILDELKEKGYRRL